MNSYKQITPIGSIENPNQLLLEMVLKGAKRIFGQLDGEVQERIEAELSIIKEKDVAWYFLFIADFVQFANDNNIWIGPGRGSAAGSIVNYCLGITKVDPLAHGLIFERFFNIDSLVLPDIDLDFEIGGREKVITYLKHQYGQDHVVEVKNEQGVTHAATIAISNNPLPEILPLNNALELDCLTIDLLSWKYLTQLKSTVIDIEKRTGEVLSLEQINLNDPKALEIFQQGNTDGILYFEAKSMQDILQNYEPQNFNDLVVLFSLFRPSMVDQVTWLIGLKHGELLKLVPEEIKEIVEESYGLIVYQEQIMKIVHQIASFSYEQADALRKAFGKKQHEKIAEFKARFLELGTLNGHAEEVLTQIWEEILIAGPNVFNKSHSVCYTQLALQSAYVKVHYPILVEVK
jgi:DNA polymerase-3 subunit alpha